MRIIRQDNLAVGWFVGKLQPPRSSGTFVVKATISLKLGGLAQLVDEPAGPAGDVYTDDDPSKSLRYPSDFVPIKPRADVLVVGHAHTPQNQPVQSLDVTIRVGQFSKTLRVVGDRTSEIRLLRRARISEPRAFTMLPMTYERAFGGSGFKKNPIGQGWGAGPLPNVEYPDQIVEGQRADADPAGFGPTDPSWEPRHSMIGTYGGNYLNERWPGFPADFDFSYFNAAPRDQQIEEYLRGDEELEFVNLHPEHPVYQSKLPGLRARIFLNEKLETGQILWREVLLNLDTLWVDMDAEKAVLVWRGLTELRSLKLKEIEDIFALLEPLSEVPKTAEQYRAMMDVRIAEMEKEWEDEPEEDMTAEDAAFEAEFAQMDRETAEMEAEFADAEAQAVRAEAELRAALIADGIDPKLLEPSEPPAQTVAEMKKLLAAQIAQLREIDIDQAARMEQEMAALAEVEQMEAEVTAAEAEMEADEPPPLTREAVVAVATAGGSLQNQDISGIDLSGLNLSGHDLSGSDLSNASLIGARLSGANLRGADLSSADLTGADLTGAVLDDADLTGTILANAKLTGMSLAGAVLAGLDLQKADFSHCTGRGADFSQANLAEARFVRAMLPQADFNESKLGKADFRAAELQAARFEAVHAREINMQGADITGLHAADKADFTKGNFREAKGNGSIWEEAVLDGADFTRAQLIGALFTEASLQGSIYDRADLASAVFDDARLQKAVLTNANLLRASFDRADLTEANVEGSNLYEAGFWEAIIDQTNFRAANLKGTSLA